MSKCKTCGQEMMQATSCIKNKVIKFPDGTKMPAVPYKGPSVKEIRKALECWKNSEVPKSAKEKMVKHLKRLIKAMEDDPRVKPRCHDCGVNHGGFHHPRCDSEICPKCGEQLITCACFD